MPAIILVLTLALALQCPSTLSAGRDATVALKVRGAHFTLRANDAPLSLILTQLAEATGITIYLAAPAQEPVSVELVDVGLEEGLRRLFKHWDTIFLYARQSRWPLAIYILGRRSGAIAPQIARPVEAAAMASETTDNAEVNVDVERLKTSMSMGDLEETLRTALGTDASETSSLIQDLMADPQPSVRITTLQWFAGQGETGVEALVTALLDNHDVVQRVAMQLLFEQGVSNEAVQEVMAAAAEENERAVRQMLSVLLIRQ